MNELERAAVAANLEVPLTLTGLDSKLTRRDVFRLSFREKKAPALWTPAGYSQVGLTDPTPLVTHPNPLSEDKRR